MNKFKTSFASDNNSGVHPDIMKAMENSNNGHVLAYGEDPYTKAAIEMFRDYFGKEADVYFLFTGTAANVLSLDAVTNSYNTVICSDISHMNNHECGSPEKYTGCRVVAVPSVNGKIFPYDISKCLKGLEDEHYSQVKVISITQPTELGTVYTVDEIREISKFAGKNNLFLVMDGARLANAAAFLGCEFLDFTKNAGVDILSFGGTKNGMMFGEAVVFFNKKHSRYFKYIRKQGMQLGAKMRYIASSFIAYLSNKLWLNNAKNANSMAEYLKSQMHNIPEIKLSVPVETNALFPVIPFKHVQEIQKKYFFYIWEEFPDIKSVQVRWMTSFNTTKKDVDDFVSFIKKITS